MTEEVINPLRRRMIEDMTLRNFDQRIPLTCGQCERAAGTATDGRQS